MGQTNSGGTSSTSSTSNTSSTSSSLHGSPDTPLCIVCKQAAVGEGLFSRLQLCQKHRADDFALHNYDREVQEARGCGNLPLVRDLAVGMQAHVGEIEAAFSRELEVDVQLEKVRRMLSEELGGSGSAKIGVSARPETRDAGVTVREDTWTASPIGQGIYRVLFAWIAIGLIAIVFARGISTTSLEMSTASPELSTAAPEMSTAAPEMSPTASGTSMAAGETIVLNHELKLENWVHYVTVCSDSSEFRSDSSGRVVPANSAGAGSAALPQPCLITRVHGMDHLTVLSVDGSVRLRIHCEDIQWNDNSNRFWGLYGDRQLLYILQQYALTVTDLSGRKIRRILPETAGFSEFHGVSGNAATVFVSCGNKIAAFSKITGLPESLITLQQIPDADLRSMAFHEDSILVADWKHKQVLRVRIETQQVVATYPTPSTGIAQFKWPRGVAIDGRGRVFVSEFTGHSVRAVAAEDGSLLWTLGVPGETGRDGGRLTNPWGLAVVTGGPCEQLVVADGYSRLLVLNLQ